MNIFQSLSARRPQKSEFNLTHNRKFSFAPGNAIPILCQEVLPSDTWNVNHSAMVRFQPMIAPIMHMVDVCAHSFFVPSRLTMARGAFEVFITGGPKGDGKNAAGVTIEIPFFAVRGNDTPGPSYFSISEVADPGSLGDYLGMSYCTNGSLGTVSEQAVNAMPFLSFWRIWCEYFRDQNVHPDYVALYPGIFDATGEITAAIKAAQTDPTNPFDFFGVPQVCWEKDYFTSALPFAQRGNPVETPLTGTATVTYKPISQVFDSTGAVPNTAGALEVNGATEDLQVPTTGPGSLETGRIENIDEVNIESGGFSINALRLAARLQEWLEKMARGGARYVEQMLSMWGVVSSDARLQRPEYLGGGKMPVQISEVLQTSENGTTPIGEMSGHGVAAGNVTGFRKFFEEHGMLITIMFVRPKPAYQQGISRMWIKRFDKLDWAWPPFAHLGEQEVEQREIYWTLSDGADVGTFGYQQRYAEYKYIPSTVHGYFKTDLAFWHWGSIYDTAPSLSPEFVQCTPSERIFNVIDGGGSPLYAVVNNKITAVRPLPYYGEPTL